AGNRRGHWRFTVRGAREARARALVRDRHADACVETFGDRTRKGGRERHRRCTRSGSKEQDRVRPCMPGGNMALTPVGGVADTLLSAVLQNSLKAAFGSSTVGLLAPEDATDPLIRLGARDLVAL